MAQAIVDRIKVIDTDTHVTEPEDLWTSRVSVQRWGDMVPHVKWNESEQADLWYLGGEPFMSAAGSAAAGWKEPIPSRPPTLAEADPAAYDPKARIKRMDEEGIYAQVLYPNVGGFGSGRFLSLKEPELMLTCVTAYNDFLAEFAATAPGRFVPIMALPFWDVDACVKEIERAAKTGHKGILMGSEPEYFGQPYLPDPYWNPVWGLAEELGLSINFHVANGDMSSLQQGYPGNGVQTNFAKAGLQMFLGNSKTLADVIFSGLCARYPKLNFVSVESGVGFLPFVLEGMDWQWQNLGCWREHPEMDLLPSEYFKRQVYGCFWFERASVKSAIAAIGADNIMYETDFPHPTSMSPGPASTAIQPKQYIEEAFSDFPEDVLRKILFENAARVYHIL